MMRSCLYVAVLMLASGSRTAFAADDNFIFGVSEEHAKNTIVCALESMTNFHQQVAVLAEKKSNTSLDVGRRRALAATAIESFRGCIEQNRIPLESRNVDDCFLQSMYLQDEALALINRGLVAPDVWPEFWLAMRMESDEDEGWEKAWLENRLSQLTDPKPASADDRRSTPTMRAINIVSCAQRSGPMVRFRPTSE